MIRKIQILVGLLLFTLIIGSSDVTAQIRTRSDFSYTKLTDGTKVLKVKVFTKQGPVFNYINNGNIQFLTSNDTAEIDLGTLQTDEDGKVALYIDKGYVIPMDETGNMHFMFRYDGNDSCQETDDELDVLDLNINYELVMDEDSLYFVNAALTDALGNPVIDEEVFIRVKRLYSYLPIESTISDEEGNVSVQFPSDLPGDSLGNLQISVIVKESGQYGTVEAIVISDWGIPVDYSEHEVGRALWAKAGPLWMLIAIYIVIFGAWSQFCVALYFLFKMRNAKS